jgi:hypothetical protein
MKWFISGILIIAWALWLGGAVATLLFVQKLFHNDRAIALLAAPQLFLAFERYQLVLAGLAVVGLLIGARRRLVPLVLLILSAAVTATVSAVLVTPRIEQMRLAGQLDTATFRTFHGLSMLLYLIEVVLLLGAGIAMAQPTDNAALVNV